MKKQHIKLTSKDQLFLDDFLSKGIQKVRVQKRALALKKLNEGMTYQAVSDILEVSYQAVFNWEKNIGKKG